MFAKGAMEYLICSLDGRIEYIEGFTDEKSKIQGELFDKVFNGIDFEKIIDDSCKPGSSIEYKNNFFQIQKIISIDDKIIIISNQRLQNDVFNVIETELPEAFFILDLYLNFKYISLNIKNLSGFSSDELLGNSIELLLSKSSFVDFRTLLQDYLHTTTYYWCGFEPMRTQLEVARKSGSLFISQFSFKFLRDSEGNIQGLIGTLKDITEEHRRMVEMKKIQRLEAINILAGGIAHDFNNLMMGILGNIDLAKMYAEDNSKIHARLLIAEKNAFRAKELTEQLLSFAEGSTPEKNSESPELIVRRATELLRRNDKLHFQFEIPKNLWKVDVDESQMVQVFYNFFHNAEKAMQGEGLIRINLENSISTLEHPGLNKKYVRITIEDHGIGIARENYRKVFDPYFSTHSNGSGLGLAIAHSVIRNHGGFVDVESRLGYGTRFYIYLPATFEFNIIKSDKRQERPVKGRILVMDNEEIYRNVAGYMLSIIGYDADFANDGDEALDKYIEALETRPYDLIIIDLTVPGGEGGISTIARLRNVDPDVRAVVSSGYSDDPVMADFMQYGFKGVISKPYEISELSRVVTRIIKAA
ncbi:MAG: ATP-binding protein [Candidatus Zixiibacteriota bacterium]